MTSSTRETPWQSDDWNTEGRVYTCDTAAPTRLHWEAKLRQITDWTPYNETMQLVTRGHISAFNVSDIRVAATIDASDPAALKSTCDLAARSYRYEWIIDAPQGTVECRMAPDAGKAGERLTTGPIEVSLPDGPMNVEFWHVDQRMALFIDGDEVASLEYDWSGRERMLNVVGTVEWDVPDRLMGPVVGPGPAIRGFTAFSSSRPARSRPLLPPRLRQAIEEPDGPGAAVRRSRRADQPRDAGLRHVGAPSQRPWGPITSSCAATTARPRSTRGCGATRTRSSRTRSTRHPSS